MVHDHAVLLVVDTNLDLLQFIQNINLGERHRGVAVDLAGEPEQRNVQPTATSRTACRHPELSALGLEELAGVVTENVRPVRMDKMLTTEYYHNSVGNGPSPTLVV